YGSAESVLRVCLQRDRNPGGRRPALSADRLAAQPNRGVGGDGSIERERGDQRAAVAQLQSETGLVKVASSALQVAVPIRERARAAAIEECQVGTALPRHAERDGYFILSGVRGERHERRALCAALLRTSCGPSTMVGHSRRRRSRGVHPLVLLWP